MRKLLIRLTLDSLLICKIPVSKLIETPTPVSANLLREVPNRVTRWVALADQVLNEPARRRCRNKGVKQDRVTHQTQPRIEVPLSPRKRDVA